MHSPPFQSFSNWESNGEQKRWKKITFGDVVEVSDNDADPFVEHLDGIALCRQVGHHW
jgi:hypothetical protein